MAKAVKFPLEMNGEQVRDINAFKEHFDIEKVVEYFLSGELLTWLEARYYDDEAAAVKALNGSDPAVAEKLSGIFGIPYTGESAVDLEELEKRKARLARLREYTDDEDILADIDRVAFDQEELAELYDRGAEEVILCAGTFAIPKSKKGLKYTRIGNAAVSGLEEPEQDKKKEEYQERQAVCSETGSEEGNFTYIGDLTRIAENARNNRKYRGYFITGDESREYVKIASGLKNQTDPEEIKRVYMSLFRICVENGMSVCDTSVLIRSTSDTYRTDRIVNIWEFVYPFYFANKEGVGRFTEDEAKRYRKIAVGLKSQKDPERIKNIYKKLYSICAKCGFLVDEAVAHVDYESRAYQTDEIVNAEEIVFYMTAEDYITPDDDVDTE